MFQTPNHHAYAIVDGAASPMLLPKLNNSPAEYACLFQGELIPELATAAPYLIKLTQYTPITEWLIISKGLNHNIFAVVPDRVDFITLYRHFRTFLRVRGDENEMLYFRYYDPRILQDLLSNCCSEQALTVFGPVTYYLTEDNQEQFLSYQLNDQGVEQHPLVLEHA